MSLPSARVTDARTPPWRPTHSPTLSAEFATASFNHRQFPLQWIAEHRADTTIGVCIPAHNEAGTVAAIVGAIRTDLMEQRSIVDRVLVVDDHSQDGTAAAAAAAGAEVVSLAEDPPLPGKGGAMRCGMDNLDTDVVVFCDADIKEFHSRLVSGIIGPLLARPDLVMVKAAYERPGVLGDQGGRVTELCAKPLLRCLQPQLGWLSQPLAGETAVRRELVRDIPLPRGYGIEVAMLIEVARRFGPGSVAQCDVGTRIHRNRSLSDLARQADEVVATVLGLSRRTQTDP